MLALRAWPSLCREKMQVPAQALWPSLVEFRKTNMLQTLTPHLLIVLQLLRWDERAPAGSPSSPG